MIMGRAATAKARESNAWKVIHDNIPEEKFARQLRGKLFVTTKKWHQVPKNALVEQVERDGITAGVRSYHDHSTEAHVPANILQPIQSSAFERKSSSKSHAEVDGEGQGLINGKDSQTATSQISVKDSKKHTKESRFKSSNNVSSTDSAHHEEHPSDDAQDPKPAPISAAERAQARARYKEKLQAFAAARHAVGANGQPVRSRSELMAARKSKEERRKARKKEVRAQAKEAQREDANAEASRLIGGFGAAAHAGPGAHDAASEPNFTFSHMYTDEGGRKGKKRDAKGALAVAEKRERRLAGYDATKRAQIDETDAWRAAERRVNGEKVKDDVGLLKRSLKRKDKAKKKSGAAWQKREEGVKAGIRARQAKRTENLKKRRPGFEGTFKIAKRHV